MNLPSRSIDWYVFVLTILSVIMAFLLFGLLQSLNSIFNAGAGRANVRLSEAQRNAALATYQNTVQTAFREVSDALARYHRMLGDDVPNDELNVAYKAGMHFGFPFCHEGSVADPEFGAQRVGPVVKRAHRQSSIVYGLSSIVSGP